MHWPQSMKQKTEEFLYATGLGMLNSSQWLKLKELTQTSLHKSQHEGTIIAWVAHNYL